MFFNFLGFLIFSNYIVLGHSLYSVAFECGKPAIYLNNEFWVTDFTQDCLEDELSILNYCKKVYRERNITAVVASPPIDVVLSDWCEFEHRKLAKCQKVDGKRHEIRPFICLDNIPMSKLFTPVGCQLSSLDNDRSYVCENYKFWENSTREACLRRNMRFQSYLPFKPCVREKDFGSMYFAAAKVVCCENLDSEFTNSAVVMKPLTNLGNKTGSTSHKLNRLGNKLTSTENDAWGSDKTVTNYLSSTKENSSSGLLIPERERYSQAKLALSNDLHKREKVLEQEFSSEESLISPEDWLNEPVKSQLEEDSLVQEFWSKFIKLENQSERDRETLETIHHQRIEAQMLERRNAMQNAWEKAVNIKNPNNFTLFETLKRLFRVVEHDRSHYVKRFEHLRNMELPEAAQQLASIKDRLVELDILLNKSLEKINLHPELNSSLLTYANYLRNNKYRKLEAQSKAVLFADITLPDMIKLPTFQEQASLKAEKIIAKHRHHLEPLYLDKLTTNKSNKSWIKPPKRQKMLADHLFGGNQNKNSAVVMKPLTNLGNKTSSMSHKLNRLGNKLTSTENDAWDSDKTVTNYLSSAKQNSSSGLLIPERERYSQAKLALSNDLHKREKVLEQEFSSEESLISPEDWLNEPVKSQLEEDSLVQEFWSKFIKLENQSERDRETLETIHHQRIEAQMLERRNAMQNAWEKAVNIKNPNNFTLFETLKRLFRVVEHDRSHYVKRFEHLRNMELPEAAQQLASIKDRLVELDILLNKSLEKINLHPELNSSLLTYANYLRNNKYRKLEAQSKAVLFADITLPDMIKLPTFQEQASLKAEKIIAKHRHHLEPLYLDKLTTNKSNKSWIKPPKRQKMLADHLFGGNQNKSKLLKLPRIYLYYHFKIYRFF